MYWSSRNPTDITRPLAVSCTRSRTSAKAGERRSTRPTWLVTPASATVAAMARAPARSVASGFSQNTARPRAAAASTRRRCSDVQVQT